MNKTPSSAASEIINRVELPEVTLPLPTPKGMPLVKTQTDLIREVRVKIEALLGHAEINVGKLFDLKEGEVLKLNSHVDHPIALQLNGNTIACGEIVAVGDQFGLRITQVAPK